MALRSPTLTATNMSNEFAWHPIVSGVPLIHGQQLRKGGVTGVTYAAVTWMAGEPWLAILNLHSATTEVRSVPCDSELEAIQAVECWLEGLLCDQ